MVLCFKTVGQMHTYKLENLVIKLSCLRSMFNLPSLCSVPQNLLQFGISNDTIHNQ